MSEKNQITNQGRRELEVGNLLPGNDRNSVNADQVLSYV